MKVDFEEKGTRGTQRTQAQSSRCRGLTRIDVLVVVLVIAFLFLIVFPILRAARERDFRITCVDNLMQVNEALRIGEDDNAPGRAPVKTTYQTNGFNAGQVAWVDAIGTSNIVHLAKFLICPLDRETPITTNSAGLRLRISYFLNVDANEGYPQELLSGDDNLAVNGVPVKPGISEVVFSGTQLSWTAGRHRYAGTIGLADGSVCQMTSLALQNAAAYSTNGIPVFTNRLAIP